MNISEMVQSEDEVIREEARLLLKEAFKREVNAYDGQDEWDVLVEKYLRCPLEVQELINGVLISVCGFPISTLIKIAEGDEEAGYDDVCYTCPLAVTVTVDQNHPSEMRKKAFRDFKTKMAEREKKRARFRVISNDDRKE
jgi:hypothetical protein